MAPNQPARIILGTHTIGDTSAVPGVIHISDTPAVKSFLDIFASYGHTDLDTAAAYVGSEDRLGKAGAGGRFTIHTKALIAPGSLTPDKIHESVAKSLAELRVPSVETLFLHAPGRDTPLADTLAGIDAEYRAGKFRQWGVSNYSIDEVKEILKIAQEKGYAKPSVYEGHYNLLVRGGEKDLFPLLRENGIKFFAYSPAAAGIFSHKAGNNTGSKRWDKDNFVGKLYGETYGTNGIQAAADAIRQAAEKHGITAHAAALRWAEHHSVLDGKLGDAIIFGARNEEQLKQSLESLKAGPLPEGLVADIARAYEGIAQGDEAPFHM